MLINVSKGKVLAERVRLANNFLSRAKGLMFERKSNFNYALIISLSRETCIRATLHSFFVFFPIGVLFLNSEKKVVEKTLLKPFTFSYTPKKRSKYIVELEPEKLKEVEVGDELKWE